MIFDRSLVVSAAVGCMLAAPAAFLVAPSSALGQPVAALITQQPLPGAPGWTVTDVLDAPVARGDLVAAVVSTSNQSVGTRPAVIVWSSAGGVVTRMLPDATINGRTITSIPAASLRIDDAGRVLFVARDASGDRLFRIGPSTFETLLSTGDAAAGAPPGQTIAVLAGLPVVDSSLRVNGASVALIARLAGTSTADRALIQLSPTRIFIREGGVVGNDGVELLSACNLASNGTPGALTSFAAAAGSQALWLGSTPTLAAFTGQPLALPGVSAQLAAIEAWSMANAGVAIRGQADVGGTFTRGIWVVTTPGAAPARRGLVGDSIAGLGTITDMGEPAIAADGSVSLAVRVSGPDVTMLNDVALIRIGTGGIAGGATLLAREGTALTDGSGALPGLEPLMLTAPKFALAGGTVGWLGDSSGQAAILVASTTQTTRVLRVGQSISTTLGTATISSLSWPLGPTGGDDGRPAAITSTLVTSRATLTTPSGPRTALVVSTLGPPRCGRADVAGANQAVGPSGSLTADDIIVFLSWYFGSDLRADFAGTNQVPTPNGSLTADDIIVFLSAFFAGC